MTRNTLSIAMAAFLLTGASAFSANGWAAPALAGKKTGILHFKETYGNKFHILQIVGAPALYWSVKGMIRLDAKIHNESASFSPSSFTASTPFKIEAGLWKVEFALGDDPNYQPGDRKVRIIHKKTLGVGHPVKYLDCLLNWDEDDLRVKLFVRTPQFHPSIFGKVNWLKPEGTGAYSETFKITLGNAKHMFPVEIDEKIDWTPVQKFGATYTKKRLTFQGIGVIP